MQKEKLHNPDDRKILDGLKAGDESTFLNLVRENHDALISVARGYVKTRESAEEVVQETWMAVIKGLDRFQGRSSLKTWMFSILCNISKTRARRDHRTLLFSEAAGGDGQNESAVDPSRFSPSGKWEDAPASLEDKTPERLVRNREFMEVFRKSLGDLPDTQRMVVILRDVQGFSSTETCNILGLSETNQRVLLHRGRSKLRGVLERVV